MVGKVVDSRGASHSARMAALRALATCADAAGALAPDLACSFLSEWIYEPEPAELPARALRVEALQRPEAHLGRNMQWALLRGPAGTCFLVFRGSETALDWTENSNVSLREVRAGHMGSLLLHSGFWCAAEGEAERLTSALAAAARRAPVRRLVLTGGSKADGEQTGTNMHVLAPSGLPGPARRGGGPGAAARAPVRQAARARVFFCLGRAAPCNMSRTPSPLPPPPCARRQCTCGGT
ncbi:unnamed protein product [Prorocentrum cordatum]|uniref:Uncharacterized protein n=1 Tax=Prorocentrum cordatum TaxID=2364126 RepID=A0ABN9WQN5_9DINO|nr:unnamed protein product [Polarella glacialis]